MQAGFSNRRSNQRDLGKWRQPSHTSAPQSSSSCHLGPMPPHLLQRSSRSPMTAESLGFLLLKKELCAAPFLVFLFRFSSPFTSSCPSFAPSTSPSQVSSVYRHVLLFAISFSLPLHFCKLQNLLPHHVPATRKNDMPASETAMELKRLCVSSQHSPSSFLRSSNSNRVKLTKKRAAGLSSKTFRVDLQCLC